MKSYNAVLLIDDDPICNFINHEIILKRNIAQDIHIACDGKNALEFLIEYYDKHETIPELIILDLNMPGMDGFEFLQCFERIFSEGKGKTKIIIVSNLFSKSDIKTLREMGFTDYFDKPLTTEKLINALQQELFKTASKS
jgi:CheY-like chemotaxis protein